MEAIPTISYIAFRASKEAIHVLPRVYKGEKFGQGLYMCHFLAFVYFMMNAAPELSLHIDELTLEKYEEDEYYKCLR